MAQDFILGTNYWPSRKAMYWWRDFDKSFLRDDLHRLKDAGLKHIRVSLLWEDFQPRADSVSVKALDHLLSVCDMCHDLGVRATCVLFACHMNGIHWLPSWMLESRGADSVPVFSEKKLRSNRARSFYLDQEVIRAQSYLVKELMEAVGSHPTMWAWDLGNELSAAAPPPDRESAMIWLRVIIEEIRQRDEVTPITLAMHVRDLRSRTHLGPEEAGEMCDFLTIHGCPLCADFADGHLDATVPPFVGLIAKWLGGKPVLIEGLGVPTRPLLDRLSSEEADSMPAALHLEEAAANFFSRTLHLVHRGGLMGVFSRSFGDYVPELKDYPPFSVCAHERFFGLFRPDGSPKEAAAVFEDFVGLERQENEYVMDWIDITADEYWEQPDEHLPRLYRRFKDYNEGLSE
jgi:endo-1,4-beta-mannosidase